LPRAISRSGVEQDSGESKNQLEISLPTEDVVAAQFINVVASQVMTVVVTRLHRDEAEAYIFFQGDITGASYTQQGAMCQLQCLTREAAFVRAIPRFKFQGLCNHVLYDSGCKVDKDTFRYDSTVSVVSGRTLTVPGLTAQGVQWAVGGYAQVGSEYRLIVGQSGDVVTLMLSFRDDVTGSSVAVFAGCDHSFATCNTKFSNELNYGGFPFVPIYNPFESGVS